VKKETIVFVLGNKIKFSLAVLIFGSRSMVALTIGLWQRLTVCFSNLNPTNSENQT